MPCHLPSLTSLTVSAIATFLELRRLTDKHFKLWRSGQWRAKVTPDVGMNTKNGPA